MLAVTMRAEVIAMQLTGVQERCCKYWWLNVESFVEYCYVRRFGSLISIAAVKSLTYIKNRNNEFSYQYHVPRLADSYQVFWSEDDCF
jgi:hypothetical protein